MLLQCIGKFIRAIGFVFLKIRVYLAFTPESQSCPPDKLADCLYQAATKNFPGKRIRTDYSDKDPDWEENFYLRRKTLCPAVLSENYFMDNKSDLEYLQSRAGKQAVIDTHVEGITEYLNLIQYIT